jgi:hypothetical protein
MGNLLYCACPMEYFTLLTKSNPWSAHFLRARSARDLQYMHGRHTRNKRGMKCVSNAVMTRRCCANVKRMPSEYYTNVVRIPRRCHAYVAQMKRASYARHSSSKCHVKRADARFTRVASDARCALHSMGYFWSVL